MKRFFEPISGIILSLLSYEFWSDFLLSLLLAFLGGIMAYMGKLLAAKIVAFYNSKKNVFKSKALEFINTEKSKHLKK